MFSILNTQVLDTRTAQLRALSFSCVHTLSRMRMHHVVLPAMVKLGLHKRQATMGTRKVYVSECIAIRQRYLSEEHDITCNISP